MDSLKKFNLVEISPQDEVVSKYIEKYQYFHIEKETWIKSLPNARLDCWFIFDGELNIWNEVKKEFSPAPAIGGYPATNTSLLFHIPGNLSCLNLKLHLRSLTIPFFRNLYPANPYTDLSQHNIPATPINEKSIHIQGQVNIEYLDHWALNLIATSQSDLTIQSLLDVIQNKKVTTVKGLAEHSELSARNLQRVTQKAFNLSPKELLRVFSDYLLY